MRLRAAALAVATVLLGSACTRLRPESAGPLVAVSAHGLPALTDDLDLASLRAAIERTLPTWNAAQAADASRLLEILASEPDPSARRAAVLRAFRVVRVRDPLLLTAYYEPELAGSLTPDQAYPHALYGRPPDLVDVEPSALDPTCDRCRRLIGRVDDGHLRPYHTRGEIDGGVLAGRGLEIGWVADEIALFFLHVQGSGRLRLADGRTIGVRYAGSNGRPYTSLGRALIARGVLTPGAASMWDIRRHLESLPEPERAALLALNERYTFFRPADEGGATGSLNVELTPGRSIATDPRLVPLGALAYLATPATRRFVVSQDTGGAVVGAHADLFLGAGPEAEERAGRTRERGALYLLLPRGP